MEVRELSNMVVQGFVVRTDNETEMTEQGKIPELWQKFWTKLGVNQQNGENAFGVYTNYESDHTGQFDVIAGVNSETQLSNENTAQVTIAAGKYLVFTQQGEMPEAVIEAWTQVWRYFSQPDVGYQRKFTTDFERYIAEDKVEVYIAI